MRRVALGMLLLASVAAWPQASSTGPLVVAKQGAGNLVKVMPLAPIVVCNDPATGGTPCTNLATTFTDRTGGLNCVNPAQVISPTTSACRTNADAAGNFQIFASAGYYDYYFQDQTTGIWNGPYVVALGGSGNGSGTVTSVSGTTNQLDVATGTITPVVSFHNPTTFPGNATVTGNLTISGAQIVAFSKTITGILGTGASLFLPTTLPGGLVGSSQSICTDSSGNLTLTTSGCPVPTATASGASTEFQIRNSGTGLLDSDSVANYVKATHTANLQNLNVSGTFTVAGPYVQQTTFPGGAPVCPNGFVIGQTCIAIDSTGHLVVAENGLSTFLRFAKQGIGTLANSVGVCTDGSGNLTTTSCPTLTVPTGVLNQQVIYTTTTTIGGQTKPVVDWLDQNVSTTGDQSANIVAAWNAVGSKNAGWMRSNPTGNFQFNTSIAPNSFGGYAMEGVGGTGQFGAGTNFLWTGGANYAFNLDRQRDAIVGRFLINLNAVVGASGINVTQLTGTSGQISSHNFFHDIQISGLNGAGSIGFNIVGATGDGAQNNEAHTLWRVGASANSIYNTGSICMNLNSSSNARDIGFYEGEHIGCGIGYSLSGGSWHVFGGLTQNHNVALSITTGAQGGTYAFVHDEASKQGILSTGSNQYSYLFLGNTYETDTVDLTKPYWDLTNLSTAVSIANIMKTNGSVTKMVAPPVAGTFISIGDQMPNTTVANLPKLQNFSRSIVLGTTTPYTSGNTAGVAGGVLGGEAIFTGTNNNFVGDDGAYGPVNALWLGTSNLGSTATSSWYSSPGFVLSALYNDGGGASHTVPFRYKVLLTDATGTSVATWKLMPPTDPLTGTTYAGSLNFDYATNGNNFAVKSLSATGQISTTIATGTPPLSVTSTTPVANLTLTAHPQVYEAGVLTIAEKTYTNTQALTAGAATHTLGNAFTFTNSGAFGCTCTDQTAVNACRAVPASATTVTVQGTGTDTVWLSCSGH